MSDNNLGSGTGIFAAAIIGAAVGAGVALLFAPCSGKETRGWLARKGRDMQDRTMTAFEDGKAATLRVAQDLGRNIESTAKNLDGSGFTKPGNSPIRS